MTTTRRISGYGTGKRNLLYNPAVHTGSWTRVDEVEAFEFSAGTSRLHIGVERSEDKTLRATGRPIFRYDVG